MGSGPEEEDGLARRLFPAFVATAECGGDAPEAPLHPEEEAALRGAGPKRRREFRAGRACARRALARLGVSPGPLPAGADRAPLWPPGVVGSLSHTAGLCVAAVGRRSELRGLGVDAERRGAVGAKLLARIAREAEREWMARAPAPPGLDWPTLLFSAKESVYKALRGKGGPEGAPGFRAAAILAPPEAGSFQVELLPGYWPAWAPARLGGRFLGSERHVLTGVWIPSPDAGGERDS